jgi:hypothetical protein
MSNNDLNVGSHKESLKTVHYWNQSLLWSELIAGEGKNSTDFTQRPITTESIKTTLSAVPNTILEQQVSQEGQDIVQEVPEIQQSIENKFVPSVSFSEACKVLLSFFLRVLAYTAFSLAVFGVVLCTVFMGNLQQDIEVIRAFYIQGGFVMPFLCMPVAFYITVRNWIERRFS